jgi:replicative DNA helicase
MMESENIPGLKPARRREMTADRLPPHSTEAEQGVLGCILWNPAVLDDIRADLEAEDVFYDLRHKMIYDALGALHDAKKPVEIISLQQSLKDAGKLEEVGGLAYLSSLMDLVPSAGNVSYYAEVVKEKWLARRLLRVCAESAARIYSAEGSVQTILDEHERDILAIGNTAVKSAAVHVKELTRQALDRMEERFRRGRQYKDGPQTGLRYLDNIIPGFAPGQFVVVAGRPGDGKSCMVMQIAEHAALQEGHGVAVFSLEMTGISMVERQLFSLGRANLEKMRNGFLIQGDVPRLIAAAGKLSKGNLWIESTARMAIEDLEVKARRMVRKHGVKLIIVDYVQLLFLRTRGNRMDRVEEMGQVSMRLKALAMELGVPVVACAQMNRNIETSEKKRRPMLSDLRECGQIEQDADIVIFLWRPKIADPEDAESDDMQWLRKLTGVPREWCSCEYNGPEIEWQKHFRRMNAFIAKQREGRSDVDASLVFVREWCRFLDPWQPRPGDEPPAEPVSLSEGRGRVENELGQGELCAEKE